MRWRLMRCLSLSLCLLAFASVACSVGGGREIAVTAVEQGERQSFEPKRVVVKAREKVTFVVRNAGKVDHEFESDEAGIEEVVVPAGKVRKVAWQAPATSGSFPAYCDLLGHREAGMELLLVVE